MLRHPSHQHIVSRRPFKIDVVVCRKSLYYIGVYSSISATWTVLTTEQIANKIKPLCTDIMLFRTFDSSNHELAAVYQLEIITSRLCAHNKLNEDSLRIKVLSSLFLISFYGEIPACQQIVREIQVTQPLDKKPSLGRDLPIYLQFKLFYRHFEPWQVYIVRVAPTYVCECCYSNRLNNCDIIGTYHRHGSIVYPRFQPN